MRHIEDDIQAAMVRWFSLQYPKLNGCLIHCPNGGRRNIREAARLKKSGVFPGVADLMLFVPTSKFPALFIEVKTEKGKQSQYQKKWQGIIEKQGYKYIICRSLDDFMKEIELYLFTDILIYTVAS